MNRFKTNVNGGTKLFSDDIAFIDASVRESFLGLISFLGITASDSFIISGCVVTITANTYSWTGGYISLSGEILKVVAGSLNVSAGPWQLGEGVFWDLEISYDAAGLVRQNHNTYEIRHAKLYFGNKAGKMLYNATTFKNKLLELYSSTEILNKILENEEQWIAATLLNSWTNQGSPFSDVKYKKDKFGTISIKGSVMKTVPDNTVIFKLPVGYRPTEDRIFGDTKINASGEVKNYSGVSGFHLEITFKI